MVLYRICPQMDNQRTLNSPMSNGDGHSFQFPLPNTTCSRDPILPNSNARVLMFKLSKK